VSETPHNVGARGPRVVTSGRFRTFPEVDHRTEAKKLGRSALIREALRSYLKEQRRREIDDAYARITPEVADEMFEEFRDLHAAQDSFPAEHRVIRRSVPNDHSFPPERRAIRHSRPNESRASARPVTAERCRVEDRTDQPVAISRATAAARPTEPARRCSHSAWRSATIASPSRRARRSIAPSIVHVAGAPSSAAASRSARAALRYCFFRAQRRARFRNAAQRSALDMSRGSTALDRLTTFLQQELILELEDREVAVLDLRELLLDLSVEERLDVEEQDREVLVVLQLL
jgi:hypothetical protein